MIKIYKLLGLLLFILVGCVGQNEVIIDFTHPDIQYSGRIATPQNKVAELHWSGTSVKVQFEGTSIQALLQDNSGDNYYNILIDNALVAIIRPDSIKKYYHLASNMSAGKHTVEIFKRTEWSKGKTYFYGFKINYGGKITPKQKYKQKKMEFYGNSITSGYAIEDLSGGDSPDSTFTNNYLSYAAITARNYGAAYQCICKSGIGITISWDSLIMPEIYNRLDPTDAASLWDFKNYQPDVVVVNLFQNDSWLVKLPDHIEFKRRFGNKVPDDAYLINAYQEFIAKLRKQYPNAHIINALGSMDAAKEGSKWRMYIETAVTNLKDNKMYTHFMPYIPASTHPSIQDHEEMAESLIQFIDKSIDW